MKECIVGGYDISIMPGKIREIFGDLKKSNDPNQVLHMGNGQYRMNDPDKSVCLGCKLCVYFTTKQYLDVSDSTYFRYFADGAEALAKKLGFGDRHGLERFMRDHPDIWGNGYGYYMFGNSISYITSCKIMFDTYLTLGEAINHWLGVADRIQAYVNKKLSKQELKEDYDVFANMSKQDTVKQPMTV